MAEFQRQLSEIPTTNAPQAGVSDNTSAVAISGVANVLGTVGNIFSNFQAKAAENEKNAALTSYSQQITTIADGVSQGNLTSAQAMTRTRAAYKSAINNAPSMTNQFTALTSQLVNTVGLGAVIKTGNEEEQRRSRLAKDAEDAGYIVPGMNDEQVDNAILQNQQAVRALDELKSFKARQDAITSETEAEAAISQKEGKLALSNYSITQVVPFQNKTNSVVDQWKATKDWGAANEALNKQEQLISSVVSGLGSEQSEVFIKNTLLPFRTSIKNARALIDGKMEAAAYENQIKSAVAQVTIMKFQDSSLLEAYVNVKNFGTDNPLLASTLTKEVGKTLSENILNGSNNPLNILTPKGGEGRDDPEKGSSAVKEYFGIIKSGMNKASGPNKPITGDTDEEFTTMQGDVAKRVDMIFDGLNDGKQSDKASDYNNVLSLLASPEYKKYTQMEGFNLPPEKVRKSMEVLNRQYGDKLIPLVRDEFNNSNVYSDEFDKTGTAVPTLRETGTKGSVSVVFSGNGVSFQPAEGLADEFAGGAQVEADRLNNKVAPMLNQWMAAASNLSGEDAKKFWEESLMPSLFGAGDVATQSPAITPEVATPAAPKTGKLDDRLPQPEDARKEFDLISGVKSDEERERFISGIRGALDKSEDLPDDVRSFVDKLMASQTTVGRSNEQLFGGEEDGGKIDNEPVVLGQAPAGEEARQLVKSALLSREGVGDKLTSTPTGVGGITDATKEGLEKEAGRTLSDKEARELYVDKQYNLLATKAPGFTGMSVEAQAAITDLASNIGPSVLSFNSMVKAIKAGDEPEALRQTLDTATSEKATVKGIAKRRAELYNTVVTGSPITEVRQDDDGTITYLKDGIEFFAFNTKKGRHVNSRAGTIGIK